MATLTELAESVKPAAERLAELAAEMDAAQRAGDATRWLAAWHAHDDLRAAQFLADYPQYAADPDEPAPPAEPAGDRPSDLDLLWWEWYALGYDCVTAAPGPELNALQLRAAQAGYEAGWAAGLDDRSHWIDDLYRERCEADEREARGVLAARPFGPDFDLPLWASEGH